MATLVYIRGITMESAEIMRTLDAVNEPYVKVDVGNDMLMEDFLATYPNNVSLPLVIMNGNKFYDSRSLKEHLLGRPSVLLG